MKIISIKENQLFIKIPYDISLVNLIKTSFSGRQWDSNNKVWKCPVNEKNIISVYSLATYNEFTISPEAMQEIEKYKIIFDEQRKVTDVKIAASKAIDANIQIPNLKGELFPFQKAGVQFIENLNGRALVADEMGLGKTVQSIAWSLLHADKRPILVICPATLKINWQREFMKWTDIKSYVISSQDTNLRYIKGIDAYIINYDIIEKMKDLLKKMSFQIIILDECTAIKNAKRKRTKAVIDLVKDIPYIIPLTGTPILNRPNEIYNVLKILDPKTYGNFWEIATKFFGMRRTKWGMDFSGATNIKEFSDLLRSTVMIRREKCDVLSELPPKTRVVVPLKCDLKEYKRVEDNLIKYLIESKNRTKLQAERSNSVEQLTKIEYCKQEAVKAKLSQFVEWCKDFIEENGKLIIFAHHKEFINRLMNELDKFNPVKIIGGMDGGEKQKSIDAFMTNKDCKTIICSLKAAGVGITLIASSYEASLELGWTPGEHDQAEDRAHRIGQKDNVTCYYFVAEDTIEETIYDLIQEKRKIFTELMQDKNIISEERQNIMGDLVDKLIGG